MAQLSVADYDALERAIRDGKRIAIRRHRAEIVVVPVKLWLRGRREAIEARHPSTGRPLTIWVDEADAIEVLR